MRNSQAELLEWYAENAKDNAKIIHASERCVGGILEAIGHFKLGPNLSPRDVSDLFECKEDNVNPGHEVVMFFLFYERWRRGEVENCDAYIASLKASCVSTYSYNPCFSLYPQILLINDDIILLSKTTFSILLLSLFIHLVLKNL